MASTGFTRYEQETVINFNAEEQTASIYTADPVIQRKLDKLVASYPDHYKLVSSAHVYETQYTKLYEVSNKKLVSSFRAPVFMSEERKAISAANLAKLREQKQQ